MKYIVVLGDGMADRPIDALGGKNPSCGSRDTGHGQSGKKK